MHQKDNKNFLWRKSSELKVMVKIDQKMVKMVLIFTEKKHSLLRVELTILKPSLLKQKYKLDHLGVGRKRNIIKRKFQRKTPPKYNQILC